MSPHLPQSSGKENECHTQSFPQLYRNRHLSHVLYIHIPRFLQLFLPLLFIQGDRFQVVGRGEFKCRKFARKFVAIAQVPKGKKTSALEFVISFQAHTSFSLFSSFLLAAMVKKN